MKTKSRSNSKRSFLRSSIVHFTLVELLVVVAVIAILAGLLLPALNKAIQKARIIQCVNNLKGINSALVFYSDSFDGYLPSPKNDNPLPNNRKATWGGMLVYNNLLSGINLTCPGAEAMNAYCLSYCKELTPSSLATYFESHTAAEWHTTYGGYGLNFNVISVGWNNSRAKLASIKNPSRKNSVGDNRQGTDASNGQPWSTYKLQPYGLDGYAGPYGWHGVTANMLLFDGHVQGFVGPTSDRDAFHEWTKTHPQLGGTWSSISEGPSSPWILRY